MTCLRWRSVFQPFHPRREIRHVNQRRLRHIHLLRQKGSVVGSDAEGDDGASVADDGVAGRFPLIKGDASLLFVQAKAVASM